MKDETEARLRRDLSVEIEALEKRYQSLKDYLAGAQMETFEVVGILRAYKGDLSGITAHVLALYQLKGQRARITWDSLFTNIDTALETIQNSPRSSPRTAIETALNLSEPKIEEVMAYLAKLKQSL
jgi:hypothetical protein